MIHGESQVRRTALAENDRRRVANAAAHCSAVGLGVLCVHAAAMSRDGVGVVLLGGHGAGKSLAALALAEHGWRSVAGDVALVCVGNQEVGPALIGGTRQFLMRPGAYQQWFAHRVQEPLHDCAAHARLDITAAVSWVPTPVGKITLDLAVLVAVDGGARGAADQAVLDAHTSTSVWYRASSHLLERVLDDENAEPLRCMEPARVTRARMALVRAAARALPVRWMLGAPQAIADAIEARISLEDTRG